MHLATYSREPRSDCSSLFVQVFLEVHLWQISLIASNLSVGIDTVKSTVFTTIPRQVTFVEGGTNFLLLIVKPNSSNNSCNLV